MKHPIPSPPIWLLNLMPGIAKALHVKGVTLLEELSGRGGAMTYLAMEAETRSVQFILKVGPKNLLHEEAENITRASLVFERAVTVMARPVTIKGYHVLAMSLSGGSKAVSFPRFYEAADGAAVQAVIRQLLEEVLRRKHQVLGRLPVNTFSHYGRDFPELARKLRRFGCESPNLADWCIWACDHQRSQVSTLMSHGDLHGNNIVVAAGVPHLIDFGSFGPRHVMQDLAKLEREIRLKLLLKGGGDPVEYSRQYDAWEATPAARTSDAETPPEFQKAHDCIRLVREFAAQSLENGADWESEYWSVLLLQYMFAAVDVALPVPLRRAAVHLGARYCQKLCTRNNWSYNLGELDSETYVSRRRPVWRLAYSFLRLDQLPSGGWGKTLPQWMEAIWKGDPSLVVGSSMRKRGGTDMTCMAFASYLRFVERVGASDTSHVLSPDPAVVRNAFRNLSERIDSDAGLSRSSHRAGYLKVNIRHTAMGMTAFLLFGRSSDFAMIGSEELRATALYLIKNLKQWRKDTSYVFGMFCALSKLRELLTSSIGPRQFKQAGPTTLNKLVAQISRALREIQPVITSLVDYTPRPLKPGSPFQPAPFFPPYGDFWRMERSGFVMYAPLLLAEDGQSLLPHVEKDASLKQRLIQCFSELIRDIHEPRDVEKPEQSLVCNHRAIDGHEGPHNWGLTAELASLLRKQGFRKLLLNSVFYTEARLQALDDILENALLMTYDAWHRTPEIFAYTPASSFCKFLDLLEPDECSADDIARLDAGILLLLKSGVTERTLGGFVREHIFQNALPQWRKTPLLQVTENSIRDFFVQKLQSGEHTPDGQFLTDSAWEHQVSDAIQRDTPRFYDGDGGKEYAKHYAKAPVLELVTCLRSFFKTRKGKELHALDLACGPGQYAALLAEEGFKVDLYDCSSQMLEMARRQLKLRRAPPPRNFNDLAKECADASYDLVFACAMMVHVRPADAQDFYRQFFRILKPNGVLMVNYKIGDHSLIAEDGRYFAYYLDPQTPLEDLEDAGFRIEKRIQHTNHRNLRGLPRNIDWLNVVCIRP